MGALVILFVFISFFYKVGDLLWDLKDKLNWSYQAKSNLGAAIVVGWSITAYGLLMLTFVIFGDG